MKFLAIIPSRYQSSRLPGKPLADIGGKSMLQRVYQQAKKVFEHVLIATDDNRIIEHSKTFGGVAILTSDAHKSGTDRCAEALDAYQKKIKLTFDVVINIQGDEPFIQPQQLNEIKNCFSDKKTEIATLVKKIDAEKDIFNPSKPKVILKKNGDALYFSRSPIPFVRGHEKTDWHRYHCFYKHIGMYGYKADTLKIITKLPLSGLEIAEELEQNRWLENGFSIRTNTTVFESDSVDTPEDLEFVRKKYL